VVARADQRKLGPAAPRLIQRGDLLASLDRAARAKVTLILGPAGSGKTSLLRAFPPGAVTEGPDLPLARATSDLARGRLDEAAAHLTVAEASITSTPPDRKHRLEVAAAALRLSLARKRGHLAG